MSSLDINLFGDLDDPAPEAEEKPRGPFASIALEHSVDRLFDYSVPESLVSKIAVGQRVRVPLGRGNKPAYGYVVEIRPTTEVKRTKPVIDIADRRVLLRPAMMRLAVWMATYYCSPLGVVIDTLLPAAVKKMTGLGYSKMVSLVAPREDVQAMIEQKMPAKRRAVLARLLQVDPGDSIEITRLAGEAGVTVPTIRTLVKARLLAITEQADLPSLVQNIPLNSAGDGDMKLNLDQQSVFDELSPRMTDEKFTVNLVHGITGSGKTEIYLQCIRKVVEQKKQAIVLVPEIALTPQTVRRFTGRFPRVAVLHSGLTNTQRHQYWEQISQGKADVIIGARSAIFAPAPDLGVIVVDEEHESSYKQDQAPRYHARDIAIKRAQLESIPVILGSATPSLEVWNRVSAPADQDAKAQAGSVYHLLSLKRRANDSSLATVELLNMRDEIKMRRGIHLLSLRLEKLLRHTFDQKQQAILLLNRRGYANFVHCPSCQHVMQCKYCDTTMTFHRSSGEKAHGGSNAAGVHSGQLHCHYCLAVNPLPEKCPECGKKLSLFGLGTQRVEEEFARKFPDVKFARVDSDTMRRSRDYEQLLARFASGEVQVMLGTQMIAKGLDFPNVTLVGVISGDTALSLPDFRAAERTFQLVTQVAGRAGRGKLAGRVVVQTFLPDDPTLLAAKSQDFVSFANAELIQRREVGLPPFARMARIILRDEDAEKMGATGEGVAGQLIDAATQLRAPVTIKGPMPCAIARIAGYHRSQIILTSKSAAAIQAVLASVREKGHLAKSDRIAIDVDPVSLL